MNASSFQPLPEQELARDLFLRQQGLRIDAYAGAGKTTTLELLAGSTTQRGLYLAFNRSIADQARSRFPRQVHCATAHSIAFRGVRRQLGYPEWKLTGNLTTQLLLANFPMPASIPVQAGLTLSSQAYCAVLLNTLKRFLHSEQPAPHTDHVPHHGSLGALSDHARQHLAQQVIRHVQVIWNTMQQKGSVLPLGHDGYLKLWALSQPQAKMDYVMVDEAQDLNPVLMGVLKQIGCPVIYVGDPYQQIYEWRGAINAMEQVASSHRVLLSQSFRFGPAIAEAATTVIRRLGAVAPLRGQPGRASDLARVRPDVILARTNAGVIGSVLECLRRGVRCHVLGGTRELTRVLNDVERIREGSAAQSPELFGFSSWRDVMAFSGKPEGEALRSLVTLVQEYGERTMLQALARCEPEESTATVACSTAHKAKGREWDHVRVDPDFAAGFLRATLRTSSFLRKDQQESFEAEARLLYVAMTRARRAVHLPSAVMERFDLRRTTDKVLGQSSMPRIQVDPQDALSR
ncbi:UvrD-helicase domain-containing protein [Granulicella arctica]|uniref:UvrD-helicase domain-containing protein n=1 Tax=Granulicella arctica TaxID=940613 RepID=UPI0021E0C00D|nr:UvrD-helicase domain-containing protein [Granulicella arctica]